MPCPVSTVIALCPAHSPTLYRYAMRWSCWSMSRPLSRFGISEARVEFRINSRADVVRFYPWLSGRHSRALHVNAPWPRRRPRHMAARSGSSRALQRYLPCTGSAKSPLSRTSRKTTFKKPIGLWRSHFARQTHLLTNPLTSVLFRFASARTPSGPRGSGSTRSEGRRTSSSSASMLIFLKAYSDILTAQ